jgi:hypothetical protein
MATVGNSIKQKTSTEFCCEICDYVTERKSNFDNHLLTAKHQMATNGNSWQQDSSNNFCCENCNKKYKDRTGLWKHKKKCIVTTVTDSNAESFDKDQLILMLIKENSEFKTMMMEQQTTMLKVIENGTHNTTNSHNKSFNLQFFLNETCKDAMNIMDFVDSIKLQLCDLENFEKVGYINGISSIIVKNLNLLDETKRPVHCTDTKREVLYVKDEDKWQKEHENKPKIRKMIKHVTHKNTKLFKDFKEKYPGCEKSESRFSNTYDKLIVEAFGGKGDNYEEKEDKIIKNILKEIKIEKQ